MSYIRVIVITFGAFCNSVCSSVSEGVTEYPSSLPVACCSSESFNQVIIGA